MKRPAYGRRHALADEPARPARGGDRRFAWMSSRWPEPLLTYIAREVVAVGRTLDYVPPFFSLRPMWRLGRWASGTAAAATQYAPVSRVANGLAVLLRSARTRRLVAEVLAAYAGRPADRAKALVTMGLATALLPLLERHGIRHVHAHFAAMPGLAAYVLHRLAGVSYSIAAHGWDVYVDTVMLREKLAAAEFVVSCTRATRTALVHRGAPSDRTLLCYHGVPLRDLPPPRFLRDESTFRIVAVGRVVEQKGFGDLVEACRLLRRCRLRFECRIVGDGPLLPALRGRIADAGLADVVRLDGLLSQEDVFATYRRASVLCAPSVIAADGDRDGIPNVVLEAMSQGLPVVGSRLSGIPEAITHGVNGWLVDAGDPAGLAHALLAVSCERDDAVRRAHEAYARIVAQFDADENVQPLVDRLTRRPTPPAANTGRGPCAWDAAAEARR